MENAFVLTFTSPNISLLHCFISEFTDEDKNNISYKSKADILFLITQIEVNYIAIIE